METSNIRDLLYFDFEKASSIWSQFQWGKPESITVSSEETAGRDARGSIGVPQMAEANFGVTEGERRTILETRILHHDLLNRIIAMLSSSGLITNLTEQLPDDTNSISQIRTTIGQAPYIIATGHTVFEDYQRIYSISESFNDLAEFISRSAETSMKESEEYKEIQNTLDEAEKVARGHSDPKQKAPAQRRVTELKNKLDDLIEAPSLAVDDWVLDGIRLWINTFLEERINFRVYPFLEAPGFHVLCNLKRDAFIDQDLDHLLYGYGTEPNVLLSIFGLITSIPPEEGPSFDPLTEFDQMEEMSKEVSMEKALRNMFRALDGMEAFSRFSRFPNITVHPIAVFRSFGLKNTDTAA